MFRHFQNSWNMNDEEKVAERIENHVKEAIDKNNAYWEDRLQSETQKYELKFEERVQEEVNKRLKVRCDIF